MIKPEDISVGEVVRLKSGSPKLTVTGIETAEDGVTEIDVLLWHENHGFIENTFPLDLLVWPAARESL